MVNNKMGAEKMFSRILEPLRDRYEVILIDTCPSLGSLTIAKSKWSYEQIMEFVQRDPADFGEE